MSQTKQHKQGQHIPPRVYESLTCFILALSSSGEPTVLNLRLCLNIWARVLASLFCILGRRFFSRACLLCISSSLAVLLLFICSTSYRRQNQYACANEHTIMTSINSCSIFLEHPFSLHLLHHVSILIKVDLQDKKLTSFVIFSM